MKNPRRRGDEYEKHVRDMLIIRPDTGWVNHSVDEQRTLYEIFKSVSGSGSTPIHKGDLKSESYLVQAKRTDKKSFTIKLEDLRKAEMEAMNIGRDVIFIIGFYSNDRVTDEWVLMPKSSVGKI